MAQPEKCKECKFFVPHPDNPRTGTCHLDPPKEGQQGHFPEVDGEVSGCSNIVKEQL